MKKLFLALLVLVFACQYDQIKPIPPQKEPTKIEPEITIEEVRAEIRNYITRITNTKQTGPKSIDQEITIGSITEGIKHMLFEKYGDQVKFTEGSREIVSNQRELIECSASDIYEIAGMACQYFICTWLENNSSISVDGFETCIEE